MKKIISKQKVSIVIPVYNELVNIKNLITRLRSSLERTTLPYEIIFIDDNSTDGTYEYLSMLQKFDRERIIVEKKQGHRGKAFSLEQGFKIAKGTILGMIDGDLQYPPEAIGKMLEKLSDCDMVIANRKSYNDNASRKAVSGIFKFIFGKLMFGFSHDVQSGLKVFKREVWDTLGYSPKSAWAFDLEFIHKASELGFKIFDHDIDFDKRKKGISKVDIFKTSIELGVNALLVRFKKLHPYQIKSGKYTMEGSGIRYGRNKYVTHTTLSHSNSALENLDPVQRIILAVVLLLTLAGIFLQPIYFLKIVTAFLSFVYFVDVLFNLYLISKSLNYSKEITFSDSELENIDDRLLPVYTILCPLYRESSIVSQFIDAVSKIDWPKDKLDVLLLLEEDDLETRHKIEDMQLRSFVRTIIVPDSMPKTKPKACNYGLLKALGKYLVIYDAEDIPDPMQLKKAYLGFKKVKKDVICLQAKLNYYNPDHNLLTRFFTSEYSLWFDVVLTGLQSIDTIIPLGGTSNHFRTSDLLKLQGWDPFNVTEDADLGVRLFKRGYKTEIFDSTTFEEANSNIGNWVRQRSRWIKGYMQTYLVHMRKAFEFAREKKIHMLFFQLTVGGKIAFIFINPFLWLATISYFVFYRYVGLTIESFYPPLVLYMAVISLVFGNFMFMYFYMIGAVKRGQWDLIKYVLLIPFYWVMISFAGFIALFQLIFKPFYWEKTIHGFHLGRKVRKFIPEIVIEEEEQISGFQFPKAFRRWAFAFVSDRKNYLLGSLLVMATVGGNFLNFLFNAYIGRKISLEDFGTVSLFASLLSLSSIFFGALLTTVNYRSGFLIGKSGKDELAFRFWKYIRGKFFKWGILITVVWLAATPYLLRYFKSADILLFILFGLVLLARFAYSADRGFMMAKLMFVTLVVVILFEPLTKLIFAFALINFNLPGFVYLAIPLSLLSTFFLGWAIIGRRKLKTLKTIPHDSKYFPGKFFSVSILSGLSTMTFLSLDMVLAKHFLSAEDAGKYALVSLAGKMIYFMGSLSSQFIMPLISRNEGARKNSDKEFLSIFLSTAILSLSGFILFGILGGITIPLLYGNKAIFIVQYLTIFCFAMLCFTISKVFSSYYLAKKVYTFSIIGFLLAIAQFILIGFFNSSISSIVFAMTIVGVYNLILMSLLHLNLNLVVSFEKNFKDFIDLFYSRRPVLSKQGYKKSILIFNWRDIKHKWAGGAELYVYELAKRWVKAGNRVTVFCGNDGKNLREENMDGITVIRRGGFYMVYFWAFLYYIFKFRGKYDVIVDCENGIPFFTPFYAREKKFLLIHHVHQEVFLKSLIKPLAALASFLEMKLMPIAYRNVQIITVSESSKKKIIEAKLTNIEPIVIQNGVDLEKYKPAVKSKNPLVLYLGRLQYYKSIDVFIRAAKKLIEIVPNIEFVIAGDGEKKKDLENYSKKLGLENKIKFVGKVSEVEKVNLYQKAWVFVNPSFMEGWGITTIEANACGTPVVASDVPGLRDSIKNPTNGFLVPYGNHGMLAEKICDLILKEDLRVKMSWWSIYWARSFSWEKSAESFYKLIIE